MYNHLIKQLNQTLGWLKFSFMQEITFAADGRIYNSQEHKIQ